MELRLAVVLALAGITCGQKPGFSDHAHVESVVNSSPGGMVSFLCSVYPGGTVLWYKQEESGKMEVARDSLLIVSDRRFGLTSDNGAYILTIKPTSEDDSGVYMCESSDLHGSTYKHTFTVNIGEGNSATRATAATLGTITAALLLLL